MQAWKSGCCPIRHDVAEKQTRQRSLRAFAHGQRCRPQYRSHFSAVPLATMAQLKSSPSSRWQNAAMRPYVVPTFWHVRRCPAANRRSSAVAASADAVGHGCPSAQEPSVSRAAIPDRRSLIWRPFASFSMQRKVSPSVMRSTLQVNDASLTPGRESAALSVGA